jgi:membrane-associated phospholipid phosphatase
MTAAVGTVAGWLAVTVAGLAVLGASIVGARRPTIPRAEMRVFHAVNGLPNWLYHVLWLPMQLGNLVVGTLVGVVVGWVFGDWMTALAVVAATILKLVTERVIRHEMAPTFSVRRRPGTSVPGAILRGDVPVDGPSFPSGHVILVAGAACVVATALPPGIDVVVFVLTASVAVGRVYVGAHNPLDVTGGLGAGLAIGGVLAALLAR